MLELGSLATNLFINFLLAQELCDKCRTVSDQSLFSVLKAAFRRHGLRKHVTALRNIERAEYWYDEGDWAYPVLMQ